MGFYKKRASGAMGRKTGGGDAGTLVRGECGAAKHRCHPMRADITPRENPANARGARPAYPQSRVAHAGFQVFALRPRIMLARGITTHPSRSEEIPCPFSSCEKIGRAHV